MKIENEYLSVEANIKGGSLTSIFDKKRNIELLYQPLEDSWQGQDVFIFPFVARLKNGTYELDGKTYSMKNHGLIRYMVGSEKGNSIFFESNEETLERFPFKFKAEAKYELSDKCLMVKYIITNTDDVDMPFEIGGHPAFKVPGTRLDDEFNINGNFIKFPKSEKLIIADLDEATNLIKGMVPFIETDKLEMTKNLFKNLPTVILKADQIPYVDLIKHDGSGIRIHKENIKYLAIWSDIQFGDYVAVEPWQGLPDRLFGESEFTKKEDIMLLKPSSSYVFSYKIEIL